MKQRREPQDVAVFTRNHRNYLEEAAKISAQDPRKLIVFRARSKWVTALREIPAGGSLPIYMAAIGGAGEVEYEAELCDGQTEPSRGDRKTEALLDLVLKSTKDEGLWEKYGKTVETLYAIRACRRRSEPFPITSLVKFSDGRPISADYGYSYAIVRSRR
jgi:hypothetical protein